MVDFANNEQALTINEVARRCCVNPVTVRRWFARGLEHIKMGGRVLIGVQALNRFQTECRAENFVQAVIVDRETLAALKSLKSRGIVFGNSEAGSGNTTQAAVATA